MSKSRLLFLLLSLAVLLPVISGTLGRAATEEREADDSLSKHLSVFSEVLSLIRRAYVEETSMDDLLFGALNGSTDALDPMATFVPAAEVEAYSEVRQIGRGHSGLVLAKERGIAFLVAVDDGSPGASAGLMQGDIVAKVNELSTRRMPLWQLQSVFADEPGTELQLEVLRRGQTQDLTLTLGTYQSRPPEIREVQGQSVLRITRLRQADLEDLRSILARLAEQERNKLLIDLRGVAGGTGEAAFALAGLFASGRLGELQSPDEATLHFQGQETPLWQGDSVILIDSGTQGAAEIFVTVLGQLAGSRLVGRRSFGHAGRQRMIPLSDGSQLLLTDAFYNGPDGKAIDRSLIPDVVVNELSRRLAEKELSIDDLTLERGLELLQTLPDKPAEEVA